MRFFCFVLRFTGSCPKKLEVLCILYPHLKIVVACVSFLKYSKQRYFAFVSGSFLSLCFSVAQGALFLYIYMAILNYELLIFLENYLCTYFVQNHDAFFSKGLNFLLPVHTSTARLGPLNIQNEVVSDNQMMCTLSKNPHRVLYDGYF